MHACVCICACVHVCACICVCACLDPCVCVRVGMRVYLRVRVGSHRLAEPDVAVLSRGGGSSSRLGGRGLRSSGGSGWAGGVSLMFRRQQPSPGPCKRIMTDAFVYLSHETLGVKNGGGNDGEGGWAGDGSMATTRLVLPVGNPTPGSEKLVSVRERCFADQYERYFTEPTLRRLRRTSVAQSCAMEG